VGLQEFATWLQATRFSLVIQSIEWIVPLLQSVHILLIGVVFVSVLMIALRVLGLVRTEQSLAVVWDRFAPFLWGGLLLMAVTGVLLTISEPLRELMTISFRLKMLLLVIGIASAALFGRSVRRGVRAGAMETARMPAGMRLAAACTIVLWLAVIFLGRAIAYDDSIWGEWSPAVLQGTNPQ
jgi:hypothetical protein